VLVSAVLMADTNIVIGKKYKKQYTAKDHREKYDNII
jgi:hypothetical protein